jgi:hypothetical protein
MIADRSLDAADISAFVDIPTRQFSRNIFQRWSHK